ncbi:hypothetical protein B0H10DRAFT_2196353 [Mycena sp. CBHHK59/15]|nr:hypothetical protein B0H10DRAFT_2196353 [Mycena sp. CBHHK59/15]
MTDCEVDRVATAFVAAENANFKLFFSFDIFVPVASQRYDSIFDPNFDPDFDPNLAPTWVTTWSHFATGKDGGWSKSASSSWGTKLGSKLDVRSWSGPRSDIQLGKSYGDSFFAEVRSSLLNEGITITLVRVFISYRDPSRASATMSAFPSINRFFNWWSWPDDVDTTLTADTDIAYRDAAYARGGPYIMAIQDVKPDIVEITESHYIWDINPNMYL